MKMRCLLVQLSPGRVGQIAPEVKHASTRV